MLMEFKRESFKFYENKLHSLDDNAKGKAFEILCIQFLENLDLYDGLFKKVWHWSEWPKNWGRDKGIDILAELHDGAFWAIQAKAYALDETVTKTKINSFLSESNRKIISYRILIATTDLIANTVKETMNG